MMSVNLLIQLLIWSIVQGRGNGQTRPYRDTLRRIHERSIEFNLDENSPIGTELGSVALTLIPPTAVTHSDAPWLTGSGLKYKFGSPSSLFTVDAQNGQLSTRANIDAELLCARARIQESAGTTNDKIRDYRDASQNRDSGKTGSSDDITCSQDGQLIVQMDVNAVMPDASLRGVHRVTVRIHDLNDNGPKFDQVRWHRRLKEILYRKGRRLELPKATDADLLAEHSRIRYRLESTNRDPADLTGVPFQLEVTPSGQPVLVLTEDLDAETKARHKFVLVAYSPTPVWIPSPLSQKAITVSKMSKHFVSGGPTESRLEIDIEVADMNDNEPRFDSSAYNTSVTENTPLGTVIYQLVAHDADSTSQLVYSMGASTESAVMSSTFVIESDGRVRLRSFLNYELRHTYILPVEVSDGEFGDQSTLYIHVVDINDEPPAFEINPTALVAEENAAPGKLIGRVRVYDPDSSSVNGEVRCSEPAELRRQQVLSFLPDPSVNPTSDVYDLTTRVTLDREVIAGPVPKQLFVYLVCVDGHEPSGDLERTQHGIRHTSTMTATITVRDNNDHPPLFNQSVYHVTIRENNLIGDKVIQVQATDADDGENSKITYSLLDRTNFKVDSLSGWIMANIVFDRETRDSYQVTIVAMDQGKPRLSSSALLNLTVLDANDHAPTLLPFEGEVSLFDQEHTSTGRLGQRNVFVVRENSPPGTYLGDILAVDKDAGLNAELLFELVEDPVAQYDRRFRLLEQGSFYTAVSLDREEKAHYRLTVRVSDRSQVEPLTSTGTISVIVQDVNDNTPILVKPVGLLSLNLTEVSQPHHYAGVDFAFDHPKPTELLLSDEFGLVDITTESKVKPTIILSMYEKPGYLVTSLHAQDPDAGNNGRLVYYLEEVVGQRLLDSQTKPLLRADAENGNVILQRPMSKDDLGVHFFHARAADGGQPHPKIDSKILALLIKEMPKAETRPVYSQASSYYANNITSGFVLWGFEGKRNTFVIIMLATVSGLLAAVLITAIACVLRSKARHGQCLSTRTQQLRRRPVTSPGGSENGNVVVLMPGNGAETNGSLLHYGLGNGNELIGQHYQGPTGGINPSMLLEEWHICGESNCHYGDGNQPYQQRALQGNSLEVSHPSSGNSATVRTTIRPVRPVHTAYDHMTGLMYENVPADTATHESGHVDLVGVSEFSSNSHEQAGTFSNAQSFLPQSDGITGPYIKQPSGIEITYHSYFPPTGTEQNRASTTPIISKHNLDIWQCSRNSTGPEAQQYLNRYPIGASFVKRPEFSIANGINEEHTSDSGRGGSDEDEHAATQAKEADDQQFENNSCLYESHVCYNQTEGLLKAGHKQENSIPSTELIHMEFNPNAVLIAGDGQMTENKATQTPQGVQKRNEKRSTSIIQHSQKQSNLTCPPAISQSLPIDFEEIPHGYSVV